MRTLKALIISTIIAAGSFAFAAPKGFSAISAKDIKEDDVTFSYMSNDGSIELQCAHVYDRPDAWDWDVWCGKGTNMLKQYRVHFLLRQYVSKAGNKSAYEVLYWVTDRNQKAPAFSSTTQWLQFDGINSPDELSFSQGVENDYAYLTLKFKPKRN